MKVQLLLLLALVGLLCAFTSASPTTAPTISTEFDPVQDTTAETTPVEMASAITAWILATEVTTVPAQITTKVFTESTAIVTTPALVAAESSSTANTEGPTETDTRGTQGPAETEVLGTQGPAETESPGTEVPGTENPAETEVPGTETPAETEGLGTETLAETEDPPVMGITERGTSEEVIIDNGTEDGLSSGQIVSIVVGALLAVAVTTAVVIVVVRRMGKYSP